MAVLEFVLGALVVNSIFYMGLTFLQPTYTPISVKTLVGEIVGKVETITFDNKRYNVSEFLGIPFAQPPLGENRFKPSIPLAPFSAPFQALDYGSTCLQSRTEHLTKMVKISEDCLFLNIFVPGNADVSK